MSLDTWNPAQYALFTAERQQPFFDLLGLVTAHSSLRTAVDLGCGTGALTKVLHERLQLNATCGIDNSQAMLSQAEQFKSASLSFQLDSLESWRPSTNVDLIFTNAALQWSPDHPQLLRQLLTNLRPGGQIAVQVPANHDHPSHMLAAEIAREPQFRAALSGFVRVSPVLAPEDYATLLYKLGIRGATVLMKVYGHELASVQDVVEWVKGTLLTAYQAKLSPAVYATFLARYTERLSLELGKQSPYFYPFKRILLHGYLAKDESRS